MNVMHQKNIFFGIGNNSVKYLNNRLFVVVILTLFTSLSCLFSKLAIILYNLLCFVFVIFKLYSLRYYHFKKKTKDNLSYLLNDANLPVYSIIVALYNEKDVVEYLVKNLSNLIYPKDKIQIIIILEFDDIETINKILSIALDHRFTIIIAPQHKLKTKGWACNYALNYVKGKYVAIYDADDKPERYQLLKVLKLFNDSDDDLCCVQCKLNYYNKYYNLITKFFSIEYDNLFANILPFMYKMDNIICLGGSSNHFKVSAFGSNVNWWDEYNVTEDADLGIRIYINQMKIAICDSITYEESPISLFAWIKQRTRWIKGHMQTYLTHAFYNKDLLNNISLKNFLIFNLSFFVPIVIMLTTPFNLIAWYFLDKNNELYICLLFLSLLNLLMGSCVMIYQALVSTRENLSDIKHYSYLFPIYFILHVVAAFMALLQMFFQPYHWNKTRHGINKHFYS